MAVKLHRCSQQWVKLGAHPCWRVQKALDQAGIAYEVVAGPMSRSKRTHIRELSGQELYPVIELEDGRVYREPSGRWRPTSARRLQTAGQAPGLGRKLVVRPVTLLEFPVVRSKPG